MHEVVTSWFICPLKQKLFAFHFRSVGDASDFRMEHALFSSTTNGLAGDAMTRARLFLSRDSLAPRGAACRPLSLAVEGSPSALVNTGLSLARTTMLCVGQLAEHVWSDSVLP